MKHDGARRVSASVWMAASAVLIASCTPPQVKSLTETDNEYALTPEEQKLIKEAEEMRTEIRQKGMILRNDSVQSYIDSLGKRLVPAGSEKYITFNFYVLKEPSINAFALPQGTIFLHAGLLARMKNESQLAFVMAHEINHIVRRHMLEYYFKFTRTVVAAKVTDLFLTPLGVGSIIGLTAMASINGYGREKESESDEKALDMIAGAGCSVERGITFFDAMNEVKEMGGLEAYFYASHPANVARRDNLRTYIGLKKELLSGGRSDDSSAYMTVMKPVRLLNIDLRIRAKEYLYALFEIEDAVKQNIDEPIVDFYRGEALRLTAENPRDAAIEEAFRQRKQATAEMISKYKRLSDSNLIKAGTAYRRALERDSTLSGAHRGLGLIALDRRDTATTKEELNKYLNSGAQISDRRYISNLLKGLENVKN